MTRKTKAFTKNRQQGHWPELGTRPAAAVPADHELASLLRWQVSELTSLADQTEPLRGRDPVDRTALSINLGKIILNLAHIQREISPGGQDG